MIRCPYCRNGADTHVKDSRSRASGTKMYRRRKCDVCHRRFSTMETIVRIDVIGQRSPNPWLDMMLDDASL